MPWTSAFIDLFNRADTALNTTANDTTSVGNGWKAVLANSWRILGNSAQPEGTDSTAAVPLNFLNRPSGTTTYRRARALLKSTWNNERVVLYLRHTEAPTSSQYYGVFAELRPNGGFTNVDLGAHFQGGQKFSSSTSFIRETGVVYQVDFFIAANFTDITVEIRRTDTNALVASSTRASGVSATDTPGTAVAIAGAAAVDSIEYYTGDPTVVSNIEIPYTNTNIFYSPYNWRNTGTRMISNNPGAYVKFSFTGTYLGLKHNSTFANVSPENIPHVAYRIDGGVIKRVQLQSTLPVAELETSLTAGTHTAQIWFSNAGLPGNDRWTTPATVLPIESIVISTGSALSAFPTIFTKRYLFFGDSITEVAVQANNDFKPGTWAFYVSQALQGEYGQVGFASQGWTVAGFGNVPPFEQTWNSFSNGQSRVAAITGNLPDAIFICQGVNDHNQNIAAATIATAVTNTLTAMRAAVGAAVKIFLVVPFSRRAETAITTGFNNYQATPDPNTILLLLPANAGDGISTGNIFPNQFSEDGLHPNVQAGARAASFVLDAIPKAPVRTGTTALSSGVQRFGVNLKSSPVTLAGSPYDQAGTKISVLNSTGNFLVWTAGAANFLNTTSTLPAFNAFQVAPAAPITIPNADFSFGSTI